MTDTPFLAALTDALPDLILRTVLDHHVGILATVMDLAALSNVDGLQVIYDLRSHSFNFNLSQRRDLTAHVALTLIRTVLTDHPAIVSEAMDRAQIGHDQRSQILAALSNRFLAAAQVV